jgi:hypothetical protein
MAAFHFVLISTAAALQWTVHMPQHAQTQVPAQAQSSVSCTIIIILIMHNPNNCIMLDERHLSVHQTCLSSPLKELLPLHSCKTASSQRQSIVWVGCACCGNVIG